MGFEATGPSQSADGFPVYADYHGPGEDVIVFLKSIG
jgi:hypothetical protein